ncbi:MAG: glutathione peroxidase [Bacteriovoracaceae bacterium]|jgi:glutathione peroxidase|nr:glutathione peroxidase [Bacteriovoracaceae bacterium]
MSSIWNIEVKNIDGTTEKLEKYKGKALLIVNVASKCGFTPQYKELENLYKEYHNQGFEILAFPCNQFNAQEPGDEKEIKEFCSLTYDVTFPMFSKINVNGSDTHPLYQELKNSLPGIMGTKAIKWNFTKFLIDKNGNPVKRYAPNDNPKDMGADIKKALT